MAAKNSSNNGSGAMAVVLESPSLILGGSARSTAAVMEGRRNQRWRRHRMAIAERAWIGNWETKWWWRRQQGGRDGSTVVAATLAAGNDGDNGSGAMAVAAERDLSGTEWRHKGNGRGNVGAAAASMMVTVEGNGNEGLSNISSEITAK